MPARFNRVALVAGLAALVLASVAVGFVQHQRQAYANEWLRKAHPATPPPFEIQAQPPDSNPTLLLLGDSRVAEWGLPQIPGWRVVNAGVPGLTSSELVLITSKILSEVQPNFVIIQAGVNELKILGVRSDLYEPLISLCQSNLQTVAQLAAERGADVFVLPIWPTGSVPWQRSVVWSQRIPDAIQECNRRLTERLQKDFPRVRVLDVFRPAVSSDGSGTVVPPLEPRLRDTLHFTPEFYQDLTQRLRAELKR